MPLGQRLRTQWEKWIPCLHGDLPLQIPSRRILLQPTGFGLFYTVLVLVMMMGALNYNNNPALILALLLASAGVVSVLLSHLQLMGLEVIAIASEPVSAGLPLSLQVSFKSNTRRQHQGVRISLSPMSLANLDYSDDGMLHATLVLPTYTRGLMPLPPMRLATRWPMGLIEANIRLQPNVMLMVHPHPEAGPPPLPSSQTSPKAKPSTDGELSHLRPYRRGDARTQVAWKASARRGQLLVRQYAGISPAVEQLHWESVKNLPIETGISRLAYWVTNAHNHQQRWSLQLPGHPLMGPDSSLAHRLRCLDALAMLPSRQPQ